MIQVVLLHSGWSTRWAARLAALGLASCALAAPIIIAAGQTGAPPGADIVPLASGLVFTVTSHAGLVSSRGSVPIADTESVYSVADAGADKVILTFNISATSGAAAATLLENTLRSYQRTVRREDLRNAARMKILFGSDEPELMPGQTFMGTSSVVLRALHGTGNVAFVLGVNEPDQGLEALGNFAGGMSTSAGSSQLIASGVTMLLSSPTRHYYRGTIERVGSGDEPFPVLLNGKPTPLPAVHARGELKFLDRTITPELWFLDNPDNPLLLKWSVHCCYEVVTRIVDQFSAESKFGKGGIAGGMTSIAPGLAGKSCRAELTGVYFTTASAQVLPVSMPALQRFAEVLKQHADWVVTIEGHTDNIGSAEYNIDLSTRRANSVRDVLVNRFGVPATRLKTKGYGFSRSLDTNDTDLGRAHNRRVEVSRQCSS